jgi:Pyruvate/2-oxoacid:ferredoxin oxidoreductase delta subunit
VLHTSRKSIKRIERVKVNVTMAVVKWKDANPVSKVKGPIRCHKCQLMCRDSGHYLSHKCEPLSHSQTHNR